MIYQNTLNKNSKKYKRSLNIIKLKINNKSVSKIIKNYINRSNKQKAI